MRRYYSSWKPYVSVAQRKQNAEKMRKKLEKSGKSLSPILIQGKTITKSFWGMRWCHQLEESATSDQRMSKGRTYARNGSIMDLQIKEGSISSLVMGSSSYRVSIQVTPMPEVKWNALIQACTGKIDSLLELMQGHLSRSVLELLTQPKYHLLPKWSDIKASCSCPDYDSHCKHVIATLYGIAHRLDDNPELLFTLRKIDPNALIHSASTPLFTSLLAPSAFEESQLSALFGIEIDGEDFQEHANQNSLIQESTMKKLNLNPNSTTSEIALSSSQRTEHSLLTQPEGSLASIEAISNGPKKRGRPKKKIDPSFTVSTPSVEPATQTKEPPSAAEYLATFSVTQSVSNSMISPATHSAAKESESRSEKIAGVQKPVVPDASLKKRETLPHPLSQEERALLRAEQERRFREVIAKQQKGDPKKEKRGPGRPRKNRESPTQKSL